MHSTPPLSTVPLRFVLPPIIRRFLGNGTPVHIIPAQNEDLVTITIAMHTGARHDVIVGESSVTAQMLSRGTLRRDALAFAEEVENRGCSVWAACDNDACSIQGSGLIEWFEDIVRLAAECLLEPRFDETELDKLRQRLVADMKMDLVDVEWLAARACAMRTFDGHRYAQPRNGTPATLQLLHPDVLKGVHGRFLAAPRHIIVAGPVDEVRVLSSLENAFGSLPVAGEVIGSPRARVRSRAGVVALNEDAVQSAFRIALPGIGFDHPDFAGLQLVTNVLGGYTLARLFAILREQKGYTYGASAYNDVRICSANTGIATSVGNEFTADTMDVISNEVYKIGRERIDDEELENARQQLLGSFARMNETPQQTASLVWTMIQHQLPPDYFERHVMRLQCLTPEDLSAIQERYFNTTSWVVGIAGRSDVIRPAIEGYVDTVEEWSAVGYE